MMKSSIVELFSNPRYTKLIKWGKLITITSVAQITIQAIGLVSGLLIIRILPTQEYAFYTLANTMLSTMTLLSDSGISTGVMAEGGKIWQDKIALGKVLITGLELRKKFSLIIVIFFSPILFYLLIHQGASTLKSLFIVFTIIISFYSSLTAGLYHVILKLHQMVSALQLNQVKTSIGRFILSLLLIAFPLSFIAIITSGLSQIWANKNLKKNTIPYVDWSQKNDELIQNRILTIVKRLLPGILYFSFAGQINIWILSVIGSSASLAQLGALGRLSMILNVFTVINATLVVPQFARLPNNRKTLLSAFLKILFFVLVLTIGGSYCFYLLSSELLYFLGEKYANLKFELFLSIIGSLLNLSAGVSFSLFTARGWTMNPYVNIIFNLLLIIVGANSSDLTTLKGSIIFNIILSLGQFLLNSVFCLNKILNLKGNNILK